MWEKISFDEHLIENNLCHERRQPVNSEGIAGISATFRFIWNYLFWRAFLILFNRHMESFAPDSSTNLNVHWTVGLKIVSFSNSMTESRFIAFKRIKFRCCFPRPQLNSQIFWIIDESFKTTQMNFEWNNKQRVWMGRIYAYSVDINM